MKKLLALLVPALTLGLALSLVYCGGDEDPTVCDPACATGMVCVDGACVVDNCCDQTNADQIFISASGMALNLATQTGAQVRVTALSPMDALTNPTPTALATDDAGTDGMWDLACYNVTTVALGAVVLTDDIPGTGDNFFPTGTGIKGWDNNAEKQCVEGATAMALPNMLVAAFDALSDVDSATYGFVLGMVIDANKAPVSGAVLQQVNTDNGSLSDLAKVYYPTATLTGFQADTSANGMFLLPHANFAGGLTTITAVKTGMTFSPTQAAAKPRFCYFSVIQP